MHPVWSPALDLTVAPAMLAACSLAPQLDPIDKVVFRTEAEAKAAGYARSGAPGC